MSNSVGIDIPCAAITYDNHSLSSATLRQIHLLKDNPSLLITIPITDDSQSQQYSYEDFSKLSPYRKFFIILDASAAVINDTRTTTLPIPSIKMNFSLKDATSTIKEFSGHGGPDAVAQFVSATRFYADLLDEAGKIILLKFLIDTRLQGEARRCLLVRPTTINQLCLVLEERFKSHETVAQLHSKLARLQQGGRSVSKFAAEIERVADQLTGLQVAGRSSEAATVVLELVDMAACAAFKAGLRGSIKTTVIAATTNTFGEARAKALEAEAADKFDTTAHVCAMQHSEFSPRGSNRGGPHNGGYRWPNYAGNVSWNQRPVMPSPMHRGGYNARFPQRGGYSPQFQQQGVFNPQFPHRGGFSPQARGVNQQRGGTSGGRGGHQVHMCEEQPYNQDETEFFREQCTE